MEAPLDKLVQRARTAGDQQGSDNSVAKSDKRKRVKALGTSQTKGRGSREPDQQVDFRLRQRPVVGGPRGACHIQITGTFSPSRGKFEKRSVRNAVPPASVHTASSFTVT